MEVTDKNLENAMGCVFRFGERRWIDQFIAGHFNFSCAGAYIKQAERDGNNEQGDKYEAVFARLKKNDPKIDELRRMLQSDLEIMDDGEYVLLRRHSAKLIPIFCFFAFKVKDLKEGSVGEPYGENNDLVDVKLDFNDKMYQGFVNAGTDDDDSEERKYAIGTVEIEPFVKNIKSFIKSSSGTAANAKMGFIDYELRANDEFYIEPTNSYDELMYKRSRYKYQHEGRIALRNVRFSSIYDRYNLVTDGYDEKMIKRFDEPIKMCYTCHIAGRAN